MLGFHTWHSTFSASLCRLLIWVTRSTASIRCVNVGAFFRHFPACHVGGLQWNFIRPTETNQKRRKAFQWVKRHLEDACYGCILHPWILTKSPPSRRMCLDGISRQDNEVARKVEKRLYQGQRWGFQRDHLQTRIDLNPCCTSGRRLNFEKCVFHATVPQFSIL